MSGASTASAPKPSGSGVLLGLVRKLIDYGTFLAATLRRHGLGDHPAIQGRQFGTTDVALILARIARGLMRAAALEARLHHRAARLDAPPRPRAPQTRPAPTATDPASQPPTPHRRANQHCDDDETLLALPPTPEQIAEEIRHRPIGAVIADICRDLGIVPAHPIWRELEHAIMRERGHCAALFIDIVKRPWRLPIPEHWPAEPPPDIWAAWPHPPPSLAGTGPP